MLSDILFSVFFCMDNKILFSSAKESLSEYTFTSSNLGTFSPNGSKTVNLNGTQVKITLYYSYSSSSNMSSSPIYLDISGVGISISELLNHMQSFYFSVGNSVVISNTLNNDELRNKVSGSVIRITISAYEGLSFSGNLGSAYTFTFGWI